MSKLNYKRWFSISLFTLIASTMLLGLSSTGKASPIDCGIYSIDESLVVQHTYDSSNNDITIQCGGIARQTWNSIKSSAIKTTQTSPRVNNYNKTGGTNQALYDFNRMPGPYQLAGDGVRLKRYSGGTLTYYPKSTSTSTPTLSFPSTISGVTDKIRYY